jgi:radical SAM protein with 4Fe4S-binding SPASM domain
MARAPVAGDVKTRLAAAIGADAALDVYRRLLASTIDAADRVEDVDLILAVAGDRPAALEQSFVRFLGLDGDRPAWRLLAQRGAGLGERLGNVFADLVACGHDAVVAVNADSPALPPEYLAEAFELLGAAAGPWTERGEGREGCRGAARGRLVLGPAVDGGYYLIGLDAATWRAVSCELEDLLAGSPMGEAKLLDHTVAVARNLGLEVVLLPLWVDVDEARDLVLLERLAARPGGGAPAPARPRGEPLTTLREVYLHVTNRCGLACPHCYNRDNAPSPDELDTGEWADVIAQACALGASSFVIIGGDPFLRDDLLDLLETIAGAHGAAARIFFNSLVTAGLAGELAHAGHGRLRPLVSIDGLEDVNDILRGPGNYRAALASIVNLVAAGLEPVVNTVTLAPVLPGLPALARVLCDAGAARLHLIFPHARAGLADNLDLVPPGAAMLEAVRRLAAAAAEVGLEIDNFAAWNVRLRAPRDFCASGCRDLAIGPTGQVHACTITVGDPAFAAGDLRRSDLATIWRSSPSLRLVRNAHARDRADCAVCPVVGVCGGDCWMQAHYAARSAGRPAGYGAPFPYCDLLRPLFEELLTVAGPQGAAAEVDFTPFDCI